MQRVSSGYRRVGCYTGLLTVVVSKGSRVIGSQQVAAPESSSASEPPCPASSASDDGSHSHDEYDTVDAMLWLLLSLPFKGQCRLSRPVRSLDATRVGLLALSHVGMLNSDDSLRGLVTIVGSFVTNRSLDSLEWLFVRSLSPEEYRSYEG
jgi:hypothetical protein